MGKILDSDWSRQNLLRSDWLVLQGATITTLDIGQVSLFFCIYKPRRVHGQ